jgi:hypothetical protein
LAIGLFTLFGILGAARHGIHETIDIAGSAGKKIAGHVRGN